MTTQCRICGSCDAKLRIRLDGYSVYRCKECGGVYTDVTEEQAATLYTEEYFTEEFGPYFAALFGDTDDTALRAHFGRNLDVLERHVPRKGRLLDVGCAAGLFLDVARGRGWDIAGIELSEHAASVARERRGVDPVVGDVMNVDLGSEAYDAVTMLDVLEHICRPGELLERVRSLIAPGGALMLALPDDRNLTAMVAMGMYRVTFGAISYPASRVHQIYHVSYFDSDSITRLLTDHGYEVLGIYPDETVRGLINESIVTKAAIGALFAASRVTGLQNKMLVVARPA